VCKLAENLVQKASNMDSKYSWMVFWAVAGVAEGVYDAMQSDKGIEKRGKWIAIHF
jgi:hypothetical protein